MPCVDQEPSQMSHVSNWHLMYTILHHAPYLTVNRTTTRTIQSPEVHRNEFKFHAEGARFSDVHGVLAHYLAQYN